MAVAGRKPGTYIPSLAVGSPFVPGARTPFMRFSRAAAPGDFRRPTFANSIVENQIRTAGQAQFMRGAEDRDRVVLGVAPPATVDVPPGVAGGNLGPFARRAIRFPEFREVNEPANTGSGGGYAASQSGGANLRGSSPYVDMTPPVPFGTPQPTGFKFPEQTQAKKPTLEQEAAAEGKVVYTDPNTGLKRKVSQNEAALLTAQNEQSLERQLDPAAAAKSRGRVLYSDPFTGQQEEVTTAEAKIRQFRDDNAIKKTAKERYPETFRTFEKLSDDELVDLLLNPAALGEIPAEEVKTLSETELRSRGLSATAIEALKAIAQRQATAGTFDLEKARLEAEQRRRQGTP